MIGGFINEHGQLILGATLCIGTHSQEEEETKLIFFVQSSDILSNRFVSSPLSDHSKDQGRRRLNYAGETLKWNPLPFSPLSLSFSFFSFIHCMSLCSIHYS